MVWLPWVKVSVMLAGGFHGEAKTVAPSATARCAVARSRLQSDWFSLTGIRRMENPRWPSPVPNVVSRWAAVRSPAQIAWVMPPKPLIVCRCADGLMFAVAASASMVPMTDAATAPTDAAPIVVSTVRRLSSLRAPLTGSF